MYRKAFIIFIVIIVCCLTFPIHIAIIGNGHSDVLYHYIFVDFNADKFKCAKFLLDNMDYHHVARKSEISDKQYNTLLNRTDSICTSMIKIYGWQNIPLDSVFKERHKTEEWIASNMNACDNNETENIPVTELISSDFLIKQIDKAYRIWKTSSYCSQIGLEEFEEYILPFVCIPYYGSVEPMDYYANAIAPLSEMDKQSSVEDAISCYHRIISTLRDINGSLGERSSKGIVSMYSRDEDCLDIAHYGCMIFRAKGMPVAVDHVVGFRQLTGRHYFCAIYNQNAKKWQGFNSEGSLPGDEDFLGTPVLNVYRDMFAAQKDAPYFTCNKGEYIPPYLSSPCLKDVTELYVQTYSLTLPFKKNTPNKLAYLAAFNCREKDGMVACTWGKIDKGNKSVTFSKVLADVLYFPVFYTEDKATCFGEPFYLKIEKGVQKICHLPISNNKKDLTNLILTRKYPVKPNMQKLADNLVGSVIIGSNDKKFTTADTLFKLNTAPTQYLKQYKFDKVGNYRYYRFLPPSAHPNCNIAHMEWLVSTTCKYPYTKSASPEAITAPAEKQQAKPSQYRQVIDAVLKRMEDSPQYDYNPLTSAGGYPNITIQLKSPIKVEAVNLMAMHANNTITPGHTYTLLHWDGEWKICGQATAEHQYLQFKNVPANKLYWLCDITEGQEEMPFIMQNNSQQYIY